MAGAMDQERAIVKYKRWIREGAMDGTCDRSVSNGHEQQEQTQQDEGDN